MSEKTEKIERPRRVFLSAATQAPITQYVTFMPDSDGVKKGERACVLDMDLRTGQFALRQNAPHYDGQLEALEALVKMGKLVEVPTDKESSPKFQFNVKDDGSRAKKEANIELQRELAEKSDDLKTAVAENVDKDKRIKELEELLKGKK